MAQITSFNQKFSVCKQQETSQDPMVDELSQPFNSSTYSTYQKALSDSTFQDFDQSSSKKIYLDSTRYSCNGQEDSFMSEEFSKMQENQMNQQMLEVDILDSQNESKQLLYQFDLTEEDKPPSDESNLPNEMQSRFRFHLQTEGNQSIIRKPKQSPFYQNYSTQQNIVSENYVSGQELQSSNQEEKSHYIKKEQEHKPFFKFLVKKLNPNKDKNLNKVNQEPVIMQNLSQNGPNPTRNTHIKQVSVQTEEKSGKKKKISTCIRFIMAVSGNSLFNNTGKYYEKIKKLSIAKDEETTIQMMKSNIQQVSQQFKFGVSLDPKKFKPSQHPNVKKFYQMIVVKVMEVILVNFYKESCKEQQKQNKYCMKPSNRKFITPQVSEKLGTIFQDQFNEFYKEYKGHEQKDELRLKIQRLIDKQNEDNVNKMGKSAKKPGNKKATENSKDTGPCKRKVIRKK